MAALPETNLKLEDIADVVESTYGITLADHKYSTIRDACNYNHFDPKYVTPWDTNGDWTGYVLEANKPTDTSNENRWSCFKNFPFKDWTFARFRINNFSVNLNSLQPSWPIRYVCRVLKTSDDSEIAYAYMQAKRVNSEDTDSNGDFEFELDHYHCSQPSLLTSQKFVFLYETTKDWVFGADLNAIINNYGDFYVRYSVEVYYSTSPSFQTITEIENEFFYYQNSTHSMACGDPVLSFGSSPWATNLYKDVHSLSTTSPIINIPDFLSEAITQNNL